MSGGNSFRSVFMVASCAGAALCCYLVSLRVASERAALEAVETRIVLAQRDIRLLQTEIGTRGRLAQLERWNVKVLALSAPAAEQFLGGGFELAKMIAPQHRIDLQAPVVLATAPADLGKPQIQGVEPPAADDAEAGVSTRDLMHTASLKRELPAAGMQMVAANPPTTPRVEAPAREKIGTAAKAPAKPQAGLKTPAKIPASSKAPSKASAEVEPAKPKAAGADPLAPLAGPAAAKTPATKMIASSTSKDSAKKQ